jgi:hypothetical protein
VDLAEAIEVTRQRRDYLTQRIVAKRVMGWETQYDERERDAHTTLLTALGIVTRPPNPAYKEYG